MTAQAGTGLQRRINGLRGARAGAALIGIPVNAFVLAVDLTLGSAMAAVPAVLLVVLVLLICVLTRLIRGMRATVRAVPVPAVREPTFAEQVAEAVEAQRQEKWERIAEQAYRAKPPGPERLAMDLKVSGYPQLTVPRETSPEAPGGFRVIDATTGEVTLVIREPCRHPNAVPVDLLVTGERVAWVCPNCPAELPANWR